jgi:uncharacterized protein YndB with AHSA1/START domain
MQRDIKHEWLFQQPVETVWEFLTTSELLAQWLMPNDFKPIVGHKFQFKTKPRVKFGFDGIVYCEVLDLVPYQKLSYSWKGGPGNGKINLDSVVIWTLRRKENGTELILEHKGFKGWGNYITYLVMNKGWNSGIKKKLINLLTHYKNETNKR